MRLHTAFGSKAYCFLDTTSEPESFEKPVHLVIDEYVELLDEQGNYQTMTAGKNARFDLSVAEAHEMIAQLKGAIAEAEALQEVVVKQAS